MGRNIERLSVAVLATWLMGSAAGLVLVPYGSAYVFLVVFVPLVPILIVYWKTAPSRDRRPPLSLIGLLGLVPVLGWWSIPVILGIVALWAHDWGTYTPRELTFDKRWLIVTLCFTAFAGILAVFGTGLGPVVLSLAGERVHATLDLRVETARMSDPGYDAVCVYAYPDRSQIPGGVPLFDSDEECPAEMDLLADPRGVFDPVAAADVEGAVGAVGCLFLPIVVFGLLACRPSKRVAPDAWRPPDTGVPEPWRPPGGYPSDRQPPT
ncbi:hypothetical protein F4553_000671 [Allocatelliglobosispora scoriae]|uniref:Uncharacterized protein n=1 Tax=Allocatelliglobosispora scoriae TaxID=643052 RepID=A0A841BKL3_9ACTN|nr:hypothetical protein [Allocatelliglobosispora scoriae]MBB5867292.1 hypothetical protein [Allocatelliglobosispora scoriae]